jgi:uncharacterized SAM-binding protein YcdF (DUF218 family)
VLAGSPSDRLPKALELMRRRVARVLVVSNGLADSFATRNLCRARVRFEVICRRPRPFSTRGEAELVARLADARGWRRVVVVTSTYHVTRARMLFDRCLRARVAVVGARPWWPRFVFGAVVEWPKLVLALTLRRAC